MSKLPHRAVERVYRHAAVCQAGYFQFAPKDAFTHASVQSVGLLWCKSGRGTVLVNGETYNTAPFDLWILPWNRRISYEPDKFEPMLVGTIHLVPWHKPKARIEFRVPHGPSDSLFDSAERRNITCPELEGPMHLHVGPDEPLGHLIDYTITWFRRRRLDELSARSLATQLFREIDLALDRRVSPHDRLPMELQQLVLYIENHYHLGLTTREIAGIIQRSESHTLKLFRQHFGVSIKSYLLASQFNHARELLTGTSLTIGEIGQRVGLPDPYHFSRTFKKRIGIAPTEFRRRIGISGL